MSAFHFAGPQCPSRSHIMDNAMTLNLNRRQFLMTANLLAASYPDLLAMSAENTMNATQASSPKLPNIKACVFDIFGTVVDWRSSVIAEASTWGKAKGLNINWEEFTDRWRLGYRPTMDQVRKGEIPWTNLDEVHRLILDELLQHYKIQGLTEDEKTHWSQVWRRLKPWPDSVEGLTRLKKKYILSPMSNGNIALMTHLAKFSGLPWDAILGSDIVRHYKPDREMYLSAPFYLDLKPEEVLMCAAHFGDLQAAGGCGLRTAFIYRPNEYGNGHVGVPDKAKPDDFDVVSESIVDLAQQLAA